MLHNEEFDNFLKSKEGPERYTATDIYSDLLQIYEEAESKGILLTDIHTDNIGLKNSSLAMFDIT